MPTTFLDRVRAFRPTVERLEARDVPATITVNTLADAVAVDGAVSLREAIQSVNGAANVNTDVVAVGVYGTNDTINFTGLSGTITLTSNLDAITAGVVIAGNTGAGFTDRPVITVSGNRQFATFVITGPSVTISSLAIVSSLLHGIQITGAGATNAAVVGNHIGIDASGTTAVENRQSGISIENGATGANIGASSPGTRNIISGNANNGVFITGVGTSNNVVAGNYIGTDITGTLKRQNLANGVLVSTGASSNRIGGTAAADRNVISGSTSNVLINQNATGNTVQGNFIGTDATGTGRFGGNTGILISSGANQNVIGGTAAGAGNVIAFNRTGVSISAGFNSALPQNNAILGNSIFSNTQLGIDLGPSGVTANDAQDADSGPNGLQNYPVITSVVGNQAFGLLTGQPNTTYRLEFFSNTSRHASGFGEGETYLGFVNVTTDFSGKQLFTFTAPSSLVGLFVSATATNQATNDTSEFGNAVLGLATPTAVPIPVIVPPRAPVPIPTPIPQPVPVLIPPLVAPAGTPILFLSPGGPTVATGIPPVTAGQFAPTAGAQAALTAKSVLAVAQGPGGGDLVKVFNADGTLRSQFAAFPGFQGGVRLGTADINSDGFADVIAGAGIGAPNGHVKVFSGRDGSLLRSFLAFDNFAGGVNVAGGDINGDGFADLIVGTATGAAHVKVFDGQTGFLLTSFFAYAPAFAGGVTVAAADFNNDGLADVVTGAGPGAPPHVKVLEATSLANVQSNGQIADTAALASFFAFAPAFAGGVFVTAGADFNNDGVPDLVVGAGPGAGPHVKVLSGARLTQLSADNSIPDAGAVASFLAFDAGFRGGVRVGEADADGDGTIEVVVGAGPGADPDVRLLRGTTFTDVRRFDAFDVSFTGGVFVD